MKSLSAFNFRLKQLGRVMWLVGNQLYIQRHTQLRRFTSRSLACVHRLAQQQANNSSKESRYKH